MTRPTHSHPDGGLYSLLAMGIEGKDPTTGEWREGLLYMDTVTGKTFWTTTARWAERFTPLDWQKEHEEVVRLYQDEDTVAEFLFHRSSAGDLHHLFVTAGPGTREARNAMTHDQQNWISTVLRSMAEMVKMGLHQKDLEEVVDMFGDVNRFHEKFGQEYTGKPRLLPEDLHRFRAGFHAEETTEYSDEYPVLLDAIHRRDRRDILNSLEKQLDALVDAAWVILGTADIQFGRHAFLEAWKRVVTANMAKVLATEDPNAEDSGREVKYDIRKPAGWVAPDHRDLVQDNAIFDEIFNNEEPHTQERIDATGV